MNRNALLSFLLVIISSACGSKSASAPPDGGAVGPATTSSDDALRACAPGVWLTAEHACICPNGFALNTPECAASDCREANVLTLTSDATSGDFAMRRSDTMRQLSIIGGIGGVSAGTWKIQNGKLHEDFQSGSSYETDVQCAGGTLIRPSKATYIRASKGVESAVLGGLAAKAVSQVPYVP